VEGGQIKTFVLSTAIKINKELHTSMTHSPARLPQAFVGGCGLTSVLLSQCHLLSEDFLIRQTCPDVESLRLRLDVFLINKPDSHCQQTPHSNCQP
jgi:hypothetical protein